MTYLKWMIGLLLMLGLGSCQEDINEGRLIVPATITFDEDLIHYTDEDIPSLKEGVIVSHNYYENLDYIFVHTPESDYLNETQEQKKKRNEKRRRV